MKMLQKLFCKLTAQQISPFLMFFEKWFWEAPMIQNFVFFHDNQNLNNNCHNSRHSNHTHMNGTILDVE